MNSSSTMSTFLVIILFAITYMHMVIAEHCDLNEIESDCAPKLSCQPSCTNPNGAPCPRRLCTVNSCVCNTSFVRDDNDNFRCVPPAECTTVATTTRRSKCGPNEVESNCTSLPGCQPSCDNLSGTVCPMACIPNSCQCQAGFVRRSKNDLTCVEISQCNARNARAVLCGENEEYTNCVNRCQPSCQEPNRNPCPTPQCSEGCVCSAGYVRDSNDISSSCVKCPIILD